MYSYLYVYLDELVSLVMQNHVDKVIDVIESGRFNRGLLDDIGCCNFPLPLYKLTVCNKILLEDENWSDEFLPVVEESRKRCKVLLDYWKERWNCPVHLSIDFENYQLECRHFKDFDFEELFDGNMADLIALGYDENEVEFCYAVLTYKYDLIQKHLQLKTNPNVYISGNMACGKGSRDDGESYNALEHSYEFECDAFTLHGLGSFWDTTEPMSVQVRDVHAFLEAAAYGDLRKKLKELI